MPHRRQKVWFRHAGLVVTVALVLASCRDRPSAPALRDETVYSNSHVGLRFLTPENWIQVARSDRPRPDKEEHLLVRFQSPPGEKPAIFEVTLREAPAGDLLAVVRAPSHSQGGWEPLGQPESVSVGGIEATRFHLVSAKNEKESVAVRRGERLIFFTFVSPVGEAKSREQIRQVIQTVSWR